MTGSGEKGTGCPECGPPPHVGGDGRCECECHPFRVLLDAASRDGIERGPFISTLTNVLHTSTDMGATDG